MSWRTLLTVCLIGLLAWVLLGWAVVSCVNAVWP